MLITDRGAPGRWVLSTLDDPRVRQYWDPNRLIAARMTAEARPPQPVPDCCTRDEVFWDIAAVYPAGVTWTDRMPAATLFNGPVIDIAADIQSTIASLRSR